MTIYLQQAIKRFVISKNKTKPNSPIIYLCLLFKFIFHYNAKYWVSSSLFLSHIHTTQIIFISYLPSFTLSHTLIVRKMYIAFVGKKRKEQNLTVTEL